MTKHDVVNLEMKKVGDVELSKDIFAAEVKVPLIHEAIKALLANKRVGTASTKTRGEVKCSGVKPYRQKGTGRARHGSWASPLFVGGGITFGPRPRDYSLNMTRKKRRAALKSALSSKLKENKLLVINEWIPKEKTKEMAKVFKAMNVGSGLIVLDEPCQWLERAVRNIPGIDVVYAQMLNTYDVVAHDFLVCTQGVVSKIEEGLK